jgi:zinc protease
VPDPAFRFGRLPNGMRYVLRHNETPRGEVLVRMQVATGSLDERDAERGYAHFVEHMAFQGSTHVAKGEMVHLLERNGLAFGADTNAFTNFETTTYHLDLPNNTPGLIDTALMLMRETAGELLFDAATVPHESGVVQSEMRDRNTWQMRDTESRFAFDDPGAYYPRRIPIGTTETLNAATADTLRAFWKRNYVPTKTTLIVIGDIDVAQVEAAIRAKFGDWQGAPSAAQPNAGPINTTDADRVAIYLDPSLSEHIAISRHGAWRDERDTWANRREVLARTIGYAIVNRRFQHLSRRLDAPFRTAQFGTGDIFKAGRNTALNIDSVDGQWRRAMIAAIEEYRRTIEQGVTPTEIAEQFTNIRAAVENDVARDDTHSNGQLVQEIFALLRNDHIPSTPAADLAWLIRQEAGLTPDAVLAAMRRDMVPLDRPLIRFTGRRAPLGGEKALRDVWAEAASAPLPKILSAPPAPFAYANVGDAGQVVADTREPGLGIRELRFANGVRLNIKHTDLARDTVLVAVNIDGGQMLAGRDNPLAVEMTGMMGTGGLGKHSLDELQTLIAGRTISMNLGAGGETFTTTAATRPSDLDLQLQVITALITDPGYRREGEDQFHQNVNTQFLRLRSTPGAALSGAIGGILSDNDPRFTLQPVEAYRALTFAKLKRDIGDRLAHGAIEVGIVGAVDEDKAIAAVAKTLGALPVREAEFLPYEAQRHRPFTTDHSPRTLTHTGPKDQALIEVVWATRDDRDPVEKQVLNMLDRVLRLQVTENLRQKLGKAYSPHASSDPSRIWRGYGTFSIGASIDVDNVAIVRAAIADTVAGLRNAPPSADVMLRARAPLLEVIDNALKTNAGWLSNVARAQSQPDGIERHLHMRERLMAVTADQVQAAAQRYLGESGAVAITVVPENGAEKAVTGPATIPPHQ